MRSVAASLLPIHGKHHHCEGYKTTQNYTRCSRCFTVTSDTFQMDGIETEQFDA